MSTSRSKFNQQNAGAWFQGAVSPLMIDVPIAPNMFQSMQKGGNRNILIQERVPLPSRQVNETFAPFKLQQGGGKQYGGYFTQGLTEKVGYHTMPDGRLMKDSDHKPQAPRTQYGGTQGLAQKARKDAQHARLAREFAARRGAGMQASRKADLPIASRTRSKTQQGGAMGQVRKAQLAQKARKDAEHSRLAREFAARRAAAMQAERLANSPPASSTRASKQKK